MKTIQFTSLLLGAVLLAACGGDGKGRSGVSKNKPIPDLTEPELDLFCDYLEDAVWVTLDEDFHIIFCHVVGALLTEDCDGYVAECLEEDPEEEELVCDIDDLPACASNVTVGDLEACAEEQADRIHAAAQTVSCDTDFEALFDDFEELGPACQIIDAKCPEWFEDEDENGARVVSTWRSHATMRRALNRARQ